MLWWGDVRGVVAETQFALNDPLLHKGIPWNCVLCSLWHVLCAVFSLYDVQWQYLVRVMCVIVSLRHVKRLGCAMCNFQFAFVACVL